MRNNQFDNYGRAARQYDSQLTANLPGEAEHAKEVAIEDESERIYSEIMDSPELVVEALQESTNGALLKLSEALGDAYRREIPSWDIQYLRKITDATGDLVMDYAKKLAEQEWEDSL